MFWLDTSIPLHLRAWLNWCTGRAWQIVASKLEDVPPRLLGVLLTLGRFPGLSSDWDKGREVLPSRHDLERWQLKDLWVEFGVNKEEWRNRRLDVEKAKNVPSCGMFRRLFYRCRKFIKTRLF